MMRGNGRFRWSRPGREPKLIPIGVALLGTLALALALAAVLTLLGIHYLHVRGFQAVPKLSADTLYNLLKVVFAFTAGVGGVFALVTAYRRQRVSEFADSRDTSRAFNERFTTAAEQLGHDQPAIRLAGVYAMARLADDWPQQRQTSVDVLCAYLRMPYQPDPGEDAPSGERQAFRAAREVRHTVIRVIAAHLQPARSRPAAMQGWQSLGFDFTGTIFDGGSFRGADFSGGPVSFTSAEFPRGEVSFNGCRFSGAAVFFDDAEFSGSAVSFTGAQFSGGPVMFDDARFAGSRVTFDHAEFSGSPVRFTTAQFSDGTISFGGARFSGGMVSFGRAEFTGGAVSFVAAEFSGTEVSFEGAGFHEGSAVSFDAARAAGSKVSFSDARLAGGMINFGSAEWPDPPQGLSWSPGSHRGVLPPLPSAPPRPGDDGCP